MLHHSGPCSTHFYLKQTKVDFCFFMAPPTPIVLSMTISYSFFPTLSTHCHFLPIIPLPLWGSLLRNARKREGLFPEYGEPLWRARNLNEGTKNIFFLVLLAESVPPLGVMAIKWCRTSCDNIACGHPSLAGRTWRVQIVASSNFLFR